MIFKGPLQPKAFCDSPSSDSLSIVNLDIYSGWCEYSLNVHPNGPLAIGMTFLFLFAHLVSLGAFYQFFNKICISLILEIGCQNCEKEFSVACIICRNEPFSPQNLCCTYEGKWEKAHVKQLFSAFNRGYILDSLLHASRQFPYC